MASDKLRRKVRNKLGIANPKPTSQQKSLQTTQEIKPLRKKGCCGRSN